MGYAQMGLSLESINVISDLDPISKVTVLSKIANKTMLENTCANWGDISFCGQKRCAAPIFVTTDAMWVKFGL